RLAAGRREDPRQHAQGGRLAGAVRSQESHHLAARDVQRDSIDGRAPAESLGEVPGLDHPTASCAGSPSTARTGRCVRNRGRTTFIHAGTRTSPPKVLKTISSASRRPISAWNFRLENHQKMVPASIVVAVKMMAFPVVAVA